ncbi:hypothetical protein [Sphingobium algorifonticola]|uniref:hypothetical protein n=1 Tax=Sphingobium algorifonticola TaxID=2008318 RepID=UPI001F49B637|nr:hypothetical protein [Sphingobium algorifonticola]
MGQSRQSAETGGCGAGAGAGGGVGAGCGTGTSRGGATQAASITTGTSGTKDKRIATAMAEQATGLNR